MTFALRSARTLAVPGTLFLVAVVIRAAFATLADFPISEDGAYYVGVARRLVEGQGLTSLSLWSYSTAPLSIPRPAFEIWLPMGSLVAAIPMLVLGTTFKAAQVGTVLLGGMVAPLTWLVAREACAAFGIPAQRHTRITVGSGLLAAVLAAFVLPGADPDSTTPFLVFGTAAALLLGWSLRQPSPVRGVTLGAALGLTYLSRQEAIWIGLACVLVAVGAIRAGTCTWSRGPMARELARWATPVVVGGLLMVVPWLLRQWISFGTPLPGQAIENALHVKSEDIFAWSDRPSLDRYLALGLRKLLEQRLDALQHQFMFVVTTLAFPVGLVGLPGWLALRRSASGSPALAVLLISGGITFLVTVLLFPVATLWGTYRHSAGPGLVGLVVLAVVWSDMLAQRFVRWRRTRGDGGWLGPLVLVALAGALSVVQGVAWGRAAGAIEGQVAAIAAHVRSIPDVSVPWSDQPATRAALITDRPMWFGTYLDVPMVALPDEPITDVVSLGRRFGTDLLIMIDVRGRYPRALFEESSRRCLSVPPQRIGPPDMPGWLVRLDLGCQM